MINVLIVEDSKVQQAFLSALFEAHPAFKVVGTARDGEEAVRQVAACHPDVVTMDIVMPVMDGVEATQMIMSQHPVPIVVVSAQRNGEEVQRAFSAMDEGALAVVQKPFGFGHPEHEKTVSDLLQKVKLMAGVRVVRRWQSRISSAPPAQVGGSREGRGMDLLAIGASTGGPQALQMILQLLPRPLPVPVLMVQHISEGFIEGYGAWLRSATGHEAQVARRGETPSPGVIYLAPDHTHLTLKPGLRFDLSTAPPVNGHCPAIDVLFASVAETMGGAAVGVLLSGMGRDGATGLLALRKAGAYTLGQDENSCVVYGMSARAKERGAVMEEGDLQQIAARLRTLIQAAERPTLLSP